MDERIKTITFVLVCWILVNWEDGVRTFVGAGWSAIISARETEMKLEPRQDRVH